MLPFNHLYWIACLVATLAVASTAFAADEPPKPQPFTFRIFGMFSPDREADLKAATSSANFMQIKLLSVDYAKGEATFEFDPAKVFPGAKPEQVVERFGNMLRDSSHSTFDLKPKLTMPREKLKKLEIACIGLDCKACSFAAYQSVMRLDGVEQCEVIFRESRVTAFVDPAKVDKAKIETTLKEKGLKIKEPVK